MAVFVVGSLNMDLVINAPYMPENGVTVSGSGFMTNPGGKGANQAAAVAKLGGNVKMVGCVGDAFGSELKNTLASYGADVTYVKELRGVSSGIAVIVVVDGDNRIFLDAGANGMLDNALVDEALSNAKKGDILVCQLEVSPSVVLHAFKKGREKGTVNVLNPAPARELPDEIFPLVDIIVPNRSEAEFYSGVRINDEDDAEKSARFFAKKGTNCTIVTLGAEGSAAFSGGEKIRVKGKKVEPVDTTAAGDTYIGALVTKLSEGAPLAEALRFATEASAITVTRRGAQQSIPTREEVE